MKRAAVLITVMLFIGSNIFGQSVKISSFSPLGGAAGTVLTLNGAGLDSTTQVSIGTIELPVLSISPTQLTALVIPGVITGAISLKTAAGSIVKSGVFSMASAGIPAIPFGSKVFDASAIGANQASSVALSSDGKTAVVGAPSDGILGSTRIYTLTPSGWVQQGPKLVGSGAQVDTGAENEGIVEQGYAVAISADGNTVAVGGPFDGYAGSVWIFKRSNGVWSQAGDKISFTGIKGGYFGSTLSMSADGNTLVGGGRYSTVTGNCVPYIYGNINGAWTPEFTMLTENPGYLDDASGVAISADGNTVALGNGALYYGLGGRLYFCP